MVKTNLHYTSCENKNEWRCCKTGKSINLPAYSGWIHEIDTYLRLPMRVYRMAEVIYLITRKANLYTTGQPAPPESQHELQVSWFVQLWVHQVSLGSLEPFQKV